MTTLTIKTTDPAKEVELTLLPQAASALVLENWSHQPRDGFQIPHTELVSRRRNAERAVTVHHGEPQKFRNAEIREFIKAHELFTELELNPRIFVTEQENETNNPSSKE